jgi:hypothetical protein
MITTINHNINIDLGHKTNINKSINMKKNDTNSHKFIVNIFNSGTSYNLIGTNSRIYFKKADGTIVFEDCILDSVKNNKLSVILSTQTLSCIGKVESEITIYGTSDEVLSSVTFNFNVLENIRDDIAIESTSEFTALTNALNSIDSAVANIGTIDNLNTILDDNIVEGNALDVTLKDSIETGNTTDVNVKASTVLGNAADAALKADIVISQGAQFAQEVTNARGEEENLDARLLIHESELANMTKQSFRYNTDLSTGLTAYFDSGKIKNADGYYTTYSAGSVILPDNATYYILLDVFNKKYFALRRNIHDGGILIASITTLNGAITDVTQPNIITLPKTRLPRTKRKIIDGVGKINIVLNGDSLVEGAGTGTYWIDLLFNSTYSADGYNVPSVANITVDNEAKGSQTSHYGLAMMGEAIGTNAGIGGNSAVKFKKSLGMKYDLNVKNSPIIDKRYDLAIIGYGMNGGTYKLEHLESMVAKYRKVGTEVIIITQSNVSINPLTMYSDSMFFKKLADVYGCAIADTWCYVEDKQNSGFEVHADGTHMNSEGHKAYANAIRSLLHTNYQETDYVFNNSGIRVNSKGKTRFPNSCEIAFNSFETNGTLETTVVTSDNPAMTFGGKTVDNARLTLTSGQYARFNHPNAFAVDILYEMNSTWTCDLKKSTSDTIVVSGLTFSGTSNRVGLKELVDIDTYSISGTSYANQGINIVCTSGQMRIIGVVFYVQENEEINPKTIDFVGTWGEEAWQYNTYFSKFSDTIGDYLQFEFEGTGCQIQLSNKSCGGKVDVYLDGRRTMANYDLYTTSTTTYPIRMDDLAYGKHTVKIKLVGVNASALTPAIANRRLAYINGYVLKTI